MKRETSYPEGIPVTLRECLRTSRALALCASFFLVVTADAEPPGVSQIFPAGGQRGTTVEFRVGGFYLHGQAGFEMIGGGVQAAPEVKAVENFWIEGPMILKPD